MTNEKMTSCETTEEKTTTSTLPTENKEANNNHKKGMICTLAGGILWGFSGNCGQYLMQGRGLASEFLVPYRLLFAGFFLLLFCYYKEKKHVFDVWKERTDRKDILVFALFGMSLCQYTYFTAIGASNAGTATVLQYIGPCLILIYVSLRQKKKPQSYEIIAILLALTGTYLLATNGNPRTMVLSQKGLFWGILSAFSLAVYSIQPGRLIRRFGSMITAGWGMFLGGIMLLMLFRPWTFDVTVDLEIVGVMAIIILFGTIIAFSLYLEGIRCVGPKKGSLYASIEPVSAMVFSVLMNHVAFTAMDLIGFACILSMIVLLSVKKEEAPSAQVVRPAKVAAEH